MLVKTWWTHRCGWGRQRGRVLWRQFWLWLAWGCQHHLLSFWSLSYLFISTWSPGRPCMFSVDLFPEWQWYFMLIEISTGYYVFSGKIDQDIISFIDKLAVRCREFISTAFNVFLLYFLFNDIYALTQLYCNGIWFIMIFDGSVLFRDRIW